MNNNILYITWKLLFYSWNVNRMNGDMIFYILMRVIILSSLLFCSDYTSGYWNLTMEFVCVDEDIEKKLNEAILMPIMCMLCDKPQFGFFGSIKRLNDFCIRNFRIFLIFLFSWIYLYVLSVCWIAWRISIFDRNIRTENPNHAIYLNNNSNIK